MDLNHDVESPEQRSPVVVEIAAPAALKPLPEEVLQLIGGGEPIVCW